MDLVVEKCNVFCADIVLAHTNGECVRLSFSLPVHRFSVLSPDELVSLLSVLSSVLFFCFLSFHLLRLNQQEGPGLKQRGMSELEWNSSSH